MPARVDIVMENFRDAELPQPLLHRLEQMGFLTPTPIQQQAIVPALNGQDVLGTAQTGTGKTGAFGIPLVAKLLTSEEGDALVMVPTRELAVQVMQTLKKFIGKSQIATGLIIGGEPMHRQFRQLQMRPRLIVGTPGRIYDHLTRGSLKLSNTTFLVLDEVDRMLDMGFVKQLDAIAPFLPKERQTLMFSATLPKNIQNLSARYLHEPVRVSVGSTGAPATFLKQENVKLKEADKFPRLLQELGERQGSVLIFIKTKYNADAMAIKLRKEGHQVEALHGDLRQSRRSRVIEDFRKMHFNVLVATDVASRGLDIPHIEHVINYDLPQNPEDYIHRVGRTARAGATGEAINFLCPSDGGKWRAISRLMNPDQKDDNLFEGERSEGGRRGRKGRSGGFGGGNGGGFGRGRREEGGGFGSKRDDNRSGFEMRTANRGRAEQGEGGRNDRPSERANDRPNRGRDDFANRGAFAQGGRGRDERPQGEYVRNEAFAPRQKREDGFDPRRAERAGRDDVFGSSRREEAGRGRSDGYERRERDARRNDGAPKGGRGDFRNDSRKDVKADARPGVNSKKSHRKGSNPNKGKKPLNRFAA